MENQIKPALNINPDEKAELTPEEFRTQLCSWFDDRGLLQELRTHLRMQMINILKRTGIGKSVVKQGISPKIQALNMLIAEFFLHQEYHYSLCVFTTEVPLVNIFPDMPNCVLTNPAARNNNTLIKWRFAEKDMSDLLETLGIVRNSVESQHITKIYYGSDDESLLTSLIRVLYNMKIVVESKKVDHKMCTSLNLTAQPTRIDQVYQSISELLTKFKINPDCIVQIMDLIKYVISHEKKMFEDKFKQKFLAYKEKKEEEISSKLQECRSKEKELQNIFDSKRKILEDELTKAQVNMQNCSDSLQRRYEEYKEKSETLKNKEIELQKQEENLATIKKDLQQQLEEVYVKKIQLENEKKKIEINEGINEINAENNNKVVAGTNAHRSNVDKVQQTPNQVEIENALLKQTIKQMQMENSNLKSQNVDCQNRVRVLAEHAKQIKSDLEAYEAKYGLEFLRGSAEAASVLSMPSIPTVATQRRAKNFTNEGNGEQVSSYPPSSPHVPKKSYEFKRKHMHRRFNNNSPTTSEEPSYTEEILQETKQRLRNLELESEKIDRSFKEYYEAKEKSSKDKNVNYAETLCGFKAADAPSTSFGFFDIPTTSAAKMFHFQVVEKNEATDSDLCAHKKCFKNINQNKLFLQNATKTKNEISIPNAEDAKNKSSGQSANSSGILNEVAMDAASFSNVEISSDKSSLFNGDK